MQHVTLPHIYKSMHTQTQRLIHTNIFSQRDHLHSKYLKSLFLPVIKTTAAFQSCIPYHQPIPLSASPSPCCLLLFLPPDWPFLLLPGNVWKSSKNNNTMGILGALISTPMNSSSLSRVPCHHSYLSADGMVSSVTMGGKEKVRFCLARRQPSFSRRRLPFLREVMIC